MFNVQSYYLPPVSVNPPLSTFQKICQKTQQLLRSFFRSINTQLMHRDRRNFFNETQIAKLHSFQPKLTKKKSQKILFTAKQLTESDTDHRSTFKEHETKVWHEPRKARPSAAILYHDLVNGADYILDKIYDLILEKNIKNHELEKIIDSFSEIAFQLIDLLVFYVPSVFIELKKNEEYAWIINKWTFEEILTHCSHLNLPKEYLECAFNRLNKSVVQTNHLDQKILEQIEKKLLSFLLKNQLKHLIQLTNNHLSSGIHQQIKEFLLFNSNHLVSYFSGRIIEVVEKAPVEPLFLNSFRQIHIYIQSINQLYAHNHIDPCEGGRLFGENFLEAASFKEWKRKITLIGENVLHPVAKVLSRPYTTKSEKYDECAPYFEKQLSHLLNLLVPNVIFKNKRGISHELHGVHYLLKHLHIPEASKSLIQSYRQFLEALLPSTIQEKIFTYGENLLDQSLDQHTVARVEGALKRYATKQMIKWIQKAFQPKLMKQYITQIIQSVNESLIITHINFIIKKEKKTFTPLLINYFQSSIEQKKESKKKIFSTLLPLLPSLEKNEYIHALKNYLRNFKEEIQNLINENVHLVNNGLNALYKEKNHNNSIINELKIGNWEKFLKDVHAYYSGHLEPLEEFVHQFIEEKHKEIEEAFTLIDHFANPTEAAVKLFLNGNISKKAQAIDKSIENFGPALDTLITKVGKYQPKGIFGLITATGATGMLIGRAVTDLMSQLVTHAELHKEHIIELISNTLKSEKLLKNLIHSIVHPETIDDELLIKERYDAQIAHMGELCYTLSENQIGTWLTQGALNKDHQTITDVFQRIFDPITSDTLAITSVALNIFDRLMETLPERSAPIIIKVS